MSTSIHTESENPVFVTTHWSVVLAASLNDEVHAHEALAQLCQVYWFPLYAFVRRRGYSEDDAKDLTQDFFARLLGKGILARANPERGRFRSFLLASLKNFLANEWNRAQAQKRGGSQRVVSLDAESAESFYQREPASTLTPETIFDRHCAMALLDRALERLERENNDTARQRQFQLLKGFLTAPPGNAGYAAVAGKLGMPANSVAVAVHRLRARFRELMRAEVVETVASPAEVDDGLRHLCAAL